MDFKETLSRIQSINVPATRETQKLVVLLFGMDLVFFVLHIMYKLEFSDNPLLSIEKDRSYAEVYQYTKEIWAFLLLIFLAARRSRLLYSSWAVFFLYLLFDDSMQFHEIAGERISEHFQFQSLLRLRAVDFGELLVSVISGVTIFGLIAIAALRSDLTERRRSMHMFLQVLGLVFFGVVVDMIHVASPWGHEIWGLIEDGGEMLVMTVLLGYIFNLKPCGEEESNISNSQLDRRE